MRNPFKVGDTVTINSTLDEDTAYCARDTTQGKAYTVTYTGVGHCDATDSADDVVLIDDAGDTIALCYSDVSLVKE